MLKLNSSSTLSSNSNANSTSEFTSNTLRIIQKKRKKTKKALFISVHLSNQIEVISFKNLLILMNSTIQLKFKKK